MKTFGDRLRKARTDAGYTQEQLGFRVGVTKASVSAWENNREAPSFALLPALREHLRVSLDALIIGEQEGVSDAPAPRSELLAVSTTQEHALLVRFRGLSAKRREAVLALVAPED